MADKAQQYKEMMQEDKGGFTEEARKKFMSSKSNIMALYPKSRDRYEAFISWAKENQVDPTEDDFNESRRSAYDWWKIHKENKVKHDELVQEDKGGFTEEAKQKFLSSKSKVMAQYPKSRNRIEAFLSWAKANQVDPTEDNFNWSGMNAYDWWKMFKQNEVQEPGTGKKKKWKPAKVKVKDTRGLPQIVNDAIELLTTER